MSAPIILPQWGMGMNDGEVIKWLKAVGDPVAKGDQLVEIVIVIPSSLEDDERALYQRLQEISLERSGVT